MGEDLGGDCSRYIELVVQNDGCRDDNAQIEDTRQELRIRIELTSPQQTGKGAV